MTARRVPNAGPDGSGTISADYGQLTSVMALLIWSYLTSMALLLGLAMTAELDPAGAATS